MRQISNYPARTPAAQLTDNFLIQVGGLGGPYNSVTLAGIASAIGEAGSITVGLPLPADALNTGIIASGMTTPVGCTRGWNWYRNNTTGPSPDSFLGAGYALQECFDATGLLSYKVAPQGSAGQPIAAWQTIYTMALSGQITLAANASVALGRAATASNEATTLAQVNSLISNTVTSFNGRQGVVTLSLADVTAVGGAPIASPIFSGVPQAPTPSQSSNDNTVATTAYVTGMINSSRATSVLSFNGRYGAVELGPTDITQAGGALLASPVFTGTPTAPTPTAGNSSTQIATTAFIANALTTAAVSSFNTRVGAVTLTTADITGAGGAPINNPAFTGLPNAPTANPGTSTSQLATCAFVMAAVTASTTGVVSFNTRTGAVTLTNVDLTNAGGALIASPAFTGTPTAPTAPGGTNNQQLATTAFVEQAVAAATAGVASFNGRTGAVALLAADVTGVGGALLAGPTFTGVPAAPTAAPGTVSTQIATTAFVSAALANTVTAFNGRTGSVTLTNNDITAAGGLANPDPHMTGVPTAPTAIPGTSTTQVATTAFVSAAVAAFTSIVVASTPPASPQTGAGWFNLTTGQLYIWTGTTWVIAVNPPVPDLSGYVLKSGALMTGNIGFPLNTAANGSLLFNTQMVSGNPTAIAAGPTALINLTTANGLLIGVSPNLAAGATVTTVNGFLIDQRGNAGLGVAPPTDAALTNAASGGGQLFGWVADFANFSLYCYWDGTSWRRSSAAQAPFVINTASSALLIGGAPVGAVDSTFSPSGFFNLNQNGTLSLTGPTPGLSFPGIANGTHVFAWGWDGWNYNAWVDGGLQGAIIISAPTPGGGLSPCQRLYVNGSSAQAVVYYGPSSTFQWNITFSDRKLKSNIVPSAFDALAALNKLTVYSADLTNPLPGATAQHWNCSVIADEVEAILPEAFIPAMDADNYQTIRELPLIATLIKAVQQLTVRMQAIDGKAA